MATVDFDVWLPQVMPLVQGCPDPLAINAIRNACIDFCNQTNWWQMDYGPVDIDATQPYEFVVDPGIHVVQIMHAEIVDKGPLAITSLQELNNRVVNWRARTGQPLAVYQPQPGVLATYPVPYGTDEYSMRFRLALAPLRDATEIEDIVYEAYQEEIAAGALEKLLGMEGTAWANPALATKYGGDFNSAKVTGAIESAKSYGRQGQQILLRPFS